MYINKGLFTIENTPKHRKAISKVVSIILNYDTKWVILSSKFRG